MPDTSLKAQMLEAIGRLPDDATIEDVAHLVRMHEMLAKARANRATSRMMTSDEMRERYGIQREG